jgi:hypothetical protein
MHVDDPSSVGIGTYVATGAPVAKPLADGCFDGITSSLVVKVTTHSFLYSLWIAQILRVVTGEKC